MPSSHPCDVSCEFLRALRGMPSVSTLVAFGGMNPMGFCVGVASRRRARRQRRRGVLRLQAVASLPVRRWLGCWRRERAADRCATRLAVAIVEAYVESARGRCDRSRLSKGPSCPGGLNLAVSRAVSPWPTTHLRPIDGGLKYFEARRQILRTSPSRASPPTGPFLERRGRNSRRLRAHAAGGSYFYAVSDLNAAVSEVAGEPLG